MKKLKELTYWESALRTLYVDIRGVRENIKKCKDPKCEYCFHYSYDTEKQTQVCFHSDSEQFRKAPKEACEFFYI